LDWSVPLQGRTPCAAGGPPGWPVVPASGCRPGRPLAPPLATAVPSPGGRPRKPAASPAAKRQYCWAGSIAGQAVFAGQPISRRVAARAGREDGSMPDARGQDQAAPVTGPDTGFRRLVSGRLILRRFRAPDAAAFAAYRDDPAVARYQSWDAPYTLAEA